MASPDWTEYVDLTPYDKDATVIFDEAIEYARSVLPEWTPEAGNIEVAVLEAAATEAANVIAAANRVPGAVVETLLKLFGIDRSDGTKATGTVEITLTTSVNQHTIPAGTSFAYLQSNGPTLIYTLDNDLILADGVLVGEDAPVTAYTYGTDYNEPSLGASLQLLSTIPYVLSVTFDEAPHGGASAESDSQYFDRAVTTLRSFSAALVSDDQIQSWVLVNYPTDVYRCKVYNRRNDASRAASASPVDGYGLVVVAAENADPTDTSDMEVAAGTITAIEDDLDELVPVSAIVEVVNAELVEVAITADVVVRSGYNTTEVENAIVDALNAYLAPNDWEWDDGVRISSIMVVIAGVPGVYYVDPSTLEINELTPGVDLVFDYLGSLPYPNADPGHAITAT